jgi:hypothetical protein
MTEYEYKVLVDCNNQIIIGRGNVRTKVMNLSQLYFVHPTSEMDFLGKESRSLL